MPDSPLTTPPAAPAPATGAPEVSASPSADASPPPSDSPGRNWLARLIHGDRVALGGDQVALDRQSRDAQAASSQADSQEQADPATVTLTKAELDAQIKRAAQAEADRRDAKRARDAQKAERKALAESEFGSPLARKVLDELEQEDKTAALEEQNAHLSANLADLIGQYDKAIVDPIMLALPEAERVKAFQAGDGAYGWEQRGRIVKAALAAIQAEAEARLRANPAFLKDQNRRTRQTADAPVPVPAGVAPNGHADMDTLLRRRRR